MAEAFEKAAYDTMSLIVDSRSDDFQNTIFLGITAAHALTMSEGETI